MVTEEEAERLYRIKKYINQSIGWEMLNCKKHYKYTIKVPIITEDGEELALCGNYSLGGRRKKSYSFCLLYKSSIQIRKWDNTSHYYKKPTSHKHKWDGISAHKVYKVNDICLNDVNKALFDFLKECNIELNGYYRSIL